MIGDKPSIFQCLLSLQYNFHHLGIFPISHFQAHNSVVRGLTWCPSEPNYIATGIVSVIISKRFLCFFVWPIFAQGPVLR